MPAIRVFRVGGLRFLRVGRLQMSVCRVRPKRRVLWVAGTAHVVHV